MEKRDVSGRNSNRKYVIVSVGIIVAAIIAVIAYFSFPVNPVISDVEKPTGSTTRLLDSSEVPPAIVMAYNGNEYPGKLVSYELGIRKPFAQVPIYDSNLTKVIPENTVTIPKNAQVQFSIKGNPTPEAQPDGLSANAYDINGNFVKILGLSETSKDISFNLDLNEGKYIVRAVGLWLSDEDKETVNGYAIYSYRIDVSS